MNRSSARLPPDQAPLTSNDARLRRVAPLVVAAVASLVAACGGAEPAPKSPDQESSVTPDERDVPEPRTVEEALEQIARAEESLTTSKKTEASAESTTGSRERPQAGGAGRAEVPVDACWSPCRALASMKRAVDALCRMTGDTDDRCVDARRTLADNATRVSTCKCEGH